MAGKKRALVFPGQGSQTVGMGAEIREAFASARDVFEEVDDALGERLSRLIAEGPIETLTLTQNAQPALLTVSIAVLRVLEKDGGFNIAEQAAYVAGHSLGEYTALVAARAMTLAEAVRVVRRRGEAMQAAVPVGTGAMAALMGCDLDQGVSIAEAATLETGEICAAANDNGGGQLVLSGNLGAVEKALAIAAARGLKRAIKLPVSAPFHSPLMQPAAEVMAETLQLVTIVPPVVPLIANVTAAPIRDAETVRRLLVEQVTGVVRWRESIEFLKADGVSDIAEIGAGKVLCGLIRRIDKELATSAVGTPAEIDAFLAAL